MKKFLDFILDNKDIFMPPSIPESGYEKLKKIQRQERVKKGLNPNKSKKILQVFK